MDDVKKQQRGSKSRRGNDKSRSKSKYSQGSNQRLTQGNSRGAAVDRRWGCVVVAAIAVGIGLAVVLVGSMLSGVGRSTAANSSVGAGAGVVAMHDRLAIDLGVGVALGVGASRRSPGGDGDAVYFGCVSRVASSHQ